MKKSVLILCSSFSILAGFGYGSEPREWKSEGFSLSGGGNISLPARLSPVMVEAPPRRVDLRIARWQGADARNGGLSMTGFPVDLSRFPVLTFGPRSRELGSFGVELDVDAYGSGAVDAVLRAGDPLLFPDMAEKDFSFESASLVPKDAGYRVKRLFGLSDNRWRYVVVNGSQVTAVHNGAIFADFHPGSSLLLQRILPSLPLSEVPWLSYEYELPQDPGWAVQIEARIALDGFSTQRIDLFSDVVSGGGRRRLLINLNDMFQKAFPGGKGGRLKELLIYFRMDGSSVARHARIGLGRLELYRSQLPGRAGAPPVYLISTLQAVNLHEILAERLNFSGRLSILSGRWLDTWRDTRFPRDLSPEISLRSTSREKIPLLFVGEVFFLDELDSEDLSAVLGRRLFLEKNALWRVGRSDGIFCNPGGRRTRTPSLPLISYAQDVMVDGEAYVMADFSLEGKGQLRLTLSGNDPQGRRTQSDHLLLPGKPLKIRNVRIRRMTLSFWPAQDMPPSPGFCVINKIEITAFRKSPVYRPKPAAAYVSIDGGIRRENGEDWAPSGAAGVLYLAPHAPFLGPVPDWLSPKAAPSFPADMGRLNVTLSYEEILEGGKTAFLPPVSLDAGSHGLSSLSPEGIDVALDRFHMRSTQNQDIMPQAKNTKTRRLYAARTAALVLIGALMSFLWVFHEKWIPLMSAVLLRRLSFWSAQFLLLGSALYVMRGTGRKEVWGGPLLLLACSVAIRYRIRPFLAKKWGIFRHRLSSPYYLMSMALLLLSALIGTLGRSSGLNHAASTAYYLLWVGALIDLLRMARESSGGAGALREGRP
jgi:hypothetical protein